MPFEARIIILLSGLGLFILVFELVRRKRFREELSIVWLFFALTIAAGSVIDIAIDPIARLLNIAYPPALAFMLISIVMIMALLYFSMVTSDLKSKVKELSQKLAILEFEIKNKTQ